MDLLYSADHTLLGPLFAESGAKCFTFEGFRARVEEVFGAKGLDVEVTRTTFPSNSTLDDEDGRWTRYRQGCTVLAGGEAGDDDHSVEIQAFVKP
jgi:hypothetical protein